MGSRLRQRAVCVLIVSTLLVLCGARRASAELGSTGAVTVGLGISAGLQPDNRGCDTAGRGDNPLKGRPAYGSKSANYPNQWIRSTLTVKLPQKPESVQVRFRQGTGSGFVDSPGWNIDAVTLTGATSKPFWGYVAHADQCDPDGPTADAGAPKTLLARTIGVLEGSGTSPQNLPLSFSWSQATGPDVPMRDQYTSKLSFDTPDTQETKVLTFVLRANDGSRLSPASKVDVTVLRNDPPVERFSVGGGCAQSGTSPAGALGATLLGILGVAATRRRRARR